MDEVSQTILHFENLLEELGQKPLDDALYMKTAHIFTRNLQSVPVSTLCEILAYFVERTENPIYINEIKELLRIHNKELFEKYAAVFSFNIGVLSVFGVEARIDAGCPVLDDIMEEFSLENKISQPKNSSKYKKRRSKNIIRKQAKQAAIEAHNKRYDRKAEKKARRADYEAIVKKDNGN